MTSPDPAAILAQINAAREQTYQNIATAQGILAQANAAALAAARDRAAIQAIAQQTVSVDTSVGTRVFAGDTMIHGDTGWRDISSSLLGWTGTLRIRRLDDMVNIEGRNLTATETSTTTVCELPSGFHGGLRHPMPALVADMWVYSRVISNLLQLEYRTPRPDIARDVNGSFRTHHAWPTSLPGTAA